MSTHITIVRGAFLYAFALVLLLADVASAQFNAGVTFGVAKGAASGAIEEFDGTEFKVGPSLSGGVGFRFGNGLTLELNVQRIEMDLSEGGDSFGKLEVVPVLGLLKYQGRPATGDRGLSGHGEIGAGIAYRTTFTKGPAIQALERAFFPARIDVDLQSRPFVFEAGGGLDYFFNRHVALTTELRILVTFIESKWRAVGPAATVAIPGDRIDGFNGQMLVGLRVFVG